jgi:tRNA modification GTPase
MASGAAAAGETIVALSSGRPPAAIAVVRMSGLAALDVAAAVAGPLGPPRSASLRRLIDPANGATIDHALLLHFVAPDSNTGENVVEFQCHGGRAVVEALIAMLTAFDDVRAAEPGEFTRRALLNGKIDLTQAEGLAELLEAETEAQRKSALSRSEGALRRTLEAWRSRLLNLSAALEVAIDYSDEEDGARGHDDTRDLAGLVAEIDTLLGAPRIEKLRDGVRVVVAGPPNSGKSSLVNALAGQERAIVTAIPGTTRDRIEVPLSLGGVPIILVDTAGLRDSDDMVEQIGIGLARREVDEADALLWLGSADVAPVNAIIVASKCDILTDRRPGIAVSAISGEGLDELQQEILVRSADIIPAPSQLSLNKREAAHLRDARDALQRAVALSDPLLTAEEVRTARVAIDHILGRAGVDDLLDALFGRFCLGK